MALERGLHAHVPLGRDVEGGHEHALYVLRDLAHLLDRLSGRDAYEQLIAVKPAPLCRLKEVLIDLGKLHVTEDMPFEREREKRLDPARTARDDRERACRRNRRHRRVPEPLASRFVLDASLEVRELAALPGDLRRHLPALLLHELHYPLPGPERLFGVIGNAEPDEQVGEAHDPEADLAVPFGQTVALVERVAAHIDHVIEEMNACPYGPFQPVPADLVPAVGLFEHAGEVDRAQVAWFVRQKRLFPAGIGALHLAQLRSGVIAVDPVDKDDSGIAGLPGHLNDLVENLPGLHTSDHIPA